LPIPDYRFAIEVAPAAAGLADTPTGNGERETGNVIFVAGKVVDFDWVRYSSSSC
jgi:hypothetical protein